MPIRVYEETLEEAIIHHILWAACRSDQTSADANITAGWHGALTYYLVQEMRACQNNLSRKALPAKVKKQFAAGSYSQTPQLECQATVRQAKISSPAN